MPPRGRKPGSFGKAAKPGVRTLDFSEDFAVVPLQNSTTGGVFKCSYPGRCADCGRQFPAGEMVRKIDSGEYVAVSCCGEDKEEIPAGLDNEGLMMVENLADVMPPGKRRPTCPKCFQIPAANGVCGC